VQDGVRLVLQPGALPDDMRPAQYLRRSALVAASGIHTDGR
jgi:hypothetical protein